MKLIKRISDYFLTKPHWGYILIFLFSVMVFSWLQAGATLADPDSFYHAKMAKMILDGGLVMDFPWLTGTMLSYSFIDHHFLYHLLLLPWVALLPPLFGLKLATVIFASSAILAVYWFLRQLKVGGAFWFTLFLLTINPFIFRLNLAKAPALALILMIFCIYQIFNRKYLGLVVVSYLFVWLYGGWPIVIVLSLIYCALGLIWPQRWQGWLANRLGRPSIAYQNLLALLHVVVGCLAGLIFSPYFPTNLQFYWEQTYKIALVNYQSVIAVGGEWYPYSITDLLIAAMPFFILLLLCLMGFIITIRRQSLNAWFFLILSFLFFILTLKSRRYVEYFVPVTVIFCAVSFNNYLPRIKRWFKEALPQSLWPLVPLILFLLFTPIFFSDIKAVRAAFDSGVPLSRYAQASAWLEKSSQPQDIVFNSGWDDFPILFYYNDKNYYIVGLDPTFMYDYNPELYRLWYGISSGQNTENIYQVIKNVFKAKYVFVSIRQTTTLAETLENNFNFKKVYQDSDAKIFEVLP
ncbi:MAG: hypothetical protein WCX71_01800 [Candidatus Buchananbacteria bacterium]